MRKKIHRRSGQARSDGEAASFSFLAALLALAVLEHWFLVLPLPAEKLWSWSLPKRQAKEHSGAIVVPLSRCEEPSPVKRERRAGSA